MHRMARRSTPIRVNATALATIRELRQYSQSELARRVGISREYMGLLETGQRRPSLAVFERIREALMVKAGALLLDPEPYPVSDGEAVGA